MLVACHHRPSALPAPAIAGVQIVNRPSDQQGERPVANALALRKHCGPPHRLSQ
jgi:hypothetical protein